MNLYELAHHPDAWKERTNDAGELWYGSDLITSIEQFDMLCLDIDLKRPVSMIHNNEIEFRMHLLFVHWATTEDVDMEGECQ